MAGIAAIQVCLERMIRDRMRISRCTLCMGHVAVDARYALLLMDRVRKVHADVFMAGDTELRSVGILGVATHGFGDLERRTVWVMTRRAVHTTLIVGTSLPLLP